jgi:hypothetical protein
MRASGFKGITTDSTYDAWSPSRAYSHYHGGVRILSETASCRLATPITVKFDQLRPGEGYDPRKETPNFGPVWQGGEWHLRDITNHMTTAAFFLLRHAAQNREHWLQRFYEIGKEAVRPRKSGELWGYVVVHPETGSSYIEDQLENILSRGGVEIDHARGDRSFIANGVRYSAGSTLIPLNQPSGAFAKALLEVQHYPNLRNASGNPIAPYDVTAHTLPLLMNVSVKSVFSPFIYPRPGNEGFGGGTGGEGRGCGDPPTYALYRSFVPSMDEGWTRWVFLKRQEWDKCFRYESVTNREIKSNSITKYHTIIIPDQPRAATLNGHRAGTMPPEYTGGLGPEGVKALREFVEQGGTLVCLNRASDFAIEQFKLPVRDVVDGLPRTDFYVPGSILRIELDTADPLTSGMPKESIAWAENSPVFEIKSDPLPLLRVKIIAWYPKDKDPLLSGWLLGGDRIKGKAALVEVGMGKGRIILFGFRPQYRGQALATYPLFFNAISGK